MVREISLLMSWEYGMLLNFISFGYIEIFVKLGIVFILLKYILFVFLLIKKFIFVIL